MKLEILNKKGRKTLILRPDSKSEREALNSIGINRMISMSVCKCKLTDAYGEDVPVITLTDKR